MVSTLKDAPYFIMKGYFHNEIFQGLQEISEQEFQERINTSIKLIKELTDGNS